MEGELIQMHIFGRMASKSRKIFQKMLLQKLRTPRGGRFTTIWELIQKWANFAPAAATTQEAMSAVKARTFREELAKGNAKLRTERGRNVQAWKRQRVGDSVPSLQWRKPKRRRRW